MTRNDLAGLIQKMFPSFDLHNGTMFPRGYTSVEIASFDEDPIELFFARWVTTDGSIIWNRRGFHQLRRLPKIALARFIVCNFGDWSTWSSLGILEDDVSIYEYCYDLVLAWEDNLSPHFMEERSKIRRFHGVKLDNGLGTGKVKQ